MLSFTPLREIIPRAELTRLLRQDYCELEPTSPCRHTFLPGIGAILALIAWNRILGSKTWSGQKRQTP